MGLYLCVFCGDEEFDGVEVGTYSDLNYFRDMIVNKLEDGSAGARYPTLVLHSDCDGAWTIQECARLEEELESIIAMSKKLPPVEFNSDWQRAVAKSLGLRPGNLYESFIDVDGEFLLERLLALCKLAQTYNEPILFQ